MKKKIIISFENDEICQDIDGGFDDLILVVSTGCKTNPVLYNLMNRSLLRWQEQVTDSTYTYKYIPQLLMQTFEPNELEINLFSMVTEGRECSVQIRGNEDLIVEMIAYSMLENEDLATIISTSVFTAKFETIKNTLDLSIHSPICLN
jgi:hypothetical protein